MTAKEAMKQSKRGTAMVKTDKYFLIAYKDGSTAYLERVNGKIGEVRDATDEEKDRSNWEPSAEFFRLKNE